MAPADFLTPTTASLSGPAHITAIQSLLQVGKLRSPEKTAMPSVPGFNQILHLDFFPPQLLSLSNFSW